MHKSTKLTSSVRRIIYAEWCAKRPSLRSLGIRYHVDKNIIRKVVTLGRLGDFTVHDSTNRRYRTIEYGLRRLARTEERIAAAQAKRIVRGTWIDREEPGDLIRVDTKALPRLSKDGRVPMSVLPREHLYVSVDDATRHLFADILPDRTGDSASVFLDVAARRLPYLIRCCFSDNGSEFKGNSTHPFVSLCAGLGVIQKFTKPRHPWTNGKAERVIRTIMEEWYGPNRFSSYEERRASLRRYVDHYNHERRHMALGNITPVQKLASCLNGGDNAC